MGESGVCNNDYRNLLLNENLKSKRSYKGGDVGVIKSNNPSGSNTTNRVNIDARSTRGGENSPMEEASS